MPAPSAAGAVGTRYAIFCWLWWVARSAVLLVAVLYGHVLYKQHMFCAGLCCQQSGT